MNAYTQPSSADPHGEAPRSPRRRVLVATLTAAALLPAARHAVAQAESPATIAAEERRAPPLPARGSPLELPAIELLDGSRWDPARGAGKPLLVYWWASTCPFCALQSPAMEKLWRQVQARGWQWVALSIDKKREDAVAYLQKKGYTFPSAWTTAEWRQRFPKPKGLPITMLRGADGRLKLAEAGQMFDEDVAEIAKLA